MLSVSSSLFHDRDFIGIKVSDSDSIRTLDSWESWEDLWSLGETESHHARRRSGSEGAWWRGRKTAPENTMSAAQGNGRSAGPFSSQIQLTPDGKTYIAWKTILPVQLQAQPNAWEVVNGDIKPPTDTTTEANKEKYRSGNTTARAILFASIHPNVIVNLFYKVTETITAAEIWKIVKTAFEKKSGTYKNAAVTRFMAFRFESSRSVLVNLERFKELVCGLDEVGAAMDNGILTAKLAGALPRSWDPFVQSWNARKDDERSYSELCDLIRAEGIRRGQENTDVEQTNALFARMSVDRGGPRRGSFPHRGRFQARGGGSQPRPAEMKTYGRPRATPQGQHQTHYASQQRGNTHRQHNNIRCYSCGRPGHKRAQCRARRSGAEANYAEIDPFFGNDEYEYEVFMAEVGDEEVPTIGDTVILDSGCSAHLLK